ncbi:hypothetical protein [Pectobacterium brasiliense]|uniref:hypothetical protein n=1 Tax=Pectobacterium brasiliense TaxID=180957 RepID=UPI0032EC480A
MQKSRRFVRGKPRISLCHQHHARLRALNRRRPENPGFLAEFCRYAVPSAFVVAVRAASDAFPTRH